MRLVAFLAVSLMAGSASAAAYIKFDGVQARAPIVGASKGASPAQSLRKVKSTILVTVKVKRGSKLQARLKKGASMKSALVMPARGKAGALKLHGVRVYGMTPKGNMTHVTLQARKVTDINGKPVKLGTKRSKKGAKKGTRPKASKGKLHLSPRKDRRIKKKGRR